MNLQERTQALTELLAEYEQNPTAFKSIDARTRWLGQAVSLLNFSATLYQNALAAADILTHPGFPAATYEQMEARILLLVRQGISELEHGLVPPQPKMGRREPHTLWQWWKLASSEERFGMVGFFAIVFVVGYVFGQMPAIRALLRFSRHLLPAMKGH